MNNISNLLGSKPRISLNLRFFISIAISLNSQVKTQIVWCRQLHRKKPIDRHNLKKDLNIIIDKGCMKPATPNFCRSPVPAVNPGLYQKEAPSLLKKKGKNHMFMDVPVKIFKKGLYHLYQWIKLT